MHIMGALAEFEREKPRRVVAEVEWRPGELYPCVGFIVTNMARPAENVVAFYNKRGTCEQWIKEGKRARSDGRGCRAVRSRPTLCGYSFTQWPITSATSCASLAMPEPIKDWSLTSLKEKHIKDWREGRAPRPLCRLPDGLA